MKNLKTIMAAITLLCVATGCEKNSDISSGTAPQNQAGTISARHSHGTDYKQVNLVSDIAGFGAGRTDATLNNPWGIAFGENGALWISCNHTGSAVIYDRNGAQLMQPIAIPFGGLLNGSSPDGVVFNNTQNFVIPLNGKKSHFIFSTEDGIVSAWNSGDSTITVADRSATGAVYKGIALGNDHGANFLYVTNFNATTIDVYDKSFNLVSMPFSDPTIPPGFAPFNIANIGGQLYVTYALQNGLKHDDVSGPGNGYINIFNTDGTFVKRFASQGTLNSPWGITQADDEFGQGKNAILVGNFGDGRINVFDASGTFKGQLQDDGNPITIQGLWTVAFAPDRDGNRDRRESGSDRLFFTAGPGGESHGIFGYLNKE